MKSLKECGMDAIPQAYDLSLNQTAAMIEEAMSTDDLLMVLVGIYKWGFQRGQRCEKQRQKRELKAG